MVRERQRVTPPHRSDLCLSLGLAASADNDQHRLGKKASLRHQEPEDSRRKLPYWQMTDQGRNALSEAGEVGIGEAMMLWQINHGRRLSQVYLSRDLSPRVLEDRPNTFEDVNYRDAVTALLAAAAHDGHNPYTICEQALEDWEMILSDGLTDGEARRGSMR